MYKIMIVFWCALCMFMHVLFSQCVMRLMCSDFFASCVCVCVCVCVCAMLYYVYEHLFIYLFVYLFIFAFN